MFTLGYDFKPWTAAKAIADGDSILDYIGATAREHGVDGAIRFNHRVVRAEWSSADARWTVTARRTDGSDADAGDGELVTLTCDFLFGCTGYYRYDEGYSPRFEGSERFRGELIHPQHWPENFDYGGKRVVVIGTGATAVTLVPSMAERAAHVTMLQRSPSYVLSLPAKDPIADLLRKLLPARVAYPIVRWKNVFLSSLVFQLSRRAPRFMKKVIRGGVARQLPDGYAVDTHFAPTYDPWDQRLCLVPNGDLFRSIREGRASVVTDRIETFTETGVRLRLRRRAAGRRDRHRDRPQPAAARRHVDSGRRQGGRPLQDGRLQGDDVQRRPQHGADDRLHQRLLDAQGRPRRPLPRAAAQPHGRQRLRQSRAGDASTRRGRPSRSSTSDRATCCARSTSSRARARAPWRLHQNYVLDVALLRRGAIEDEALRFTRASAPAQASPPAQAVAFEAARRRSRERARRRPRRRVG